MDRFLATLLPACRRTQPRLPRQVQSWAPSTLPTEQASVPRLTSATCFTWQLPRLPLATPPTGLGGLRQATLRRRRTRSSLPGPLHASRRHLQPSSRGLGKRPRLLPLARLYARRQEEDHDRFCP